MCGLSVTMMFAVGKFNLSSDGIFYVGMAFASMIALNDGLLPGLRPGAAVIACGLLGAVIALIPAFLNVKFSASVVVCALMLNYVLQFIGRYILLYVVKDPTLTYNGSKYFHEAATLSTIIKGTRIHTGLFIAAGAVIMIYILLNKTKLGYAIRVTGQNEKFSKYVGISVVPTILISQAIGGALAGMGGAIEVMGIYKQFRIDTLLGYGFDGLLIAVVGKGNPLGVAIAALALAYLRQGAALVNSYTDIPLELVQVLQGLVVIFCAAEYLLAGIRHRMIVKDSGLSEGGAV
jgi:simple sugar transport system permease protein